MNILVFDKKLKRRSGGFTLVEILIVVAVIGVLCAMGVYGWSKARATAQRNACIQNLQVIAGAKEQWALENGKTQGATVKVQDVTPYLNQGRLPACPGGGIYSMRSVGANPRCGQLNLGHFIR